MSHVIERRMTARIEGDFVVFLIGMRINKPWRVHKWLPVAIAMPRMLKELEAHPESGLLGYELNMLSTVQYWRSFEHLENYARNPNQEHFPAWVAFNRANARTRGDVGIWHETFLVRAGEYEAVYSGVPARGLGKASRLVAADGGLKFARERLRGEILPFEPQLDPRDA